MVELEANPDYFRGKPRVERVRLKFGGAAVTELLSGNVNAAAYVDGADLHRLRDDPRFRVYHSASPRRLTAVGWNLRHELFRDPQIRLALTMAIDRRELLALLHLPVETPIFDGLVTHRQFRRGELPPPLPHDVGRARELLREAGWRDSDGDGVLDRDGRPFRFTAVTAPGQGLLESAVYIQAQLRRVGIHMDVEQLDFAAAAERVKTGRFEAAVFPFTPFNGFIPAPVYLRALGYDHPRVTELIEEARLLMDPAAIDAAYAEASRILRDDPPMTVLHPAVWHSVAHRRIQGLRSRRSVEGVAIGTDRADPVWYMEHLWLEQER